MSTSIGGIGGRGNTSTGTRTTSAPSSQQKSTKTTSTPKSPSKTSKKTSEGNKDPTMKDLQDQIENLKEALGREEKERNYFQLEADKINTFWEITKKELSERKAELRNKDREMEELEERHQVEIKVYKQKVKHLLYEHQNDITLLKADEETALKLQNDEHKEAEYELKKQQKKIKSDLKEVELSHEDVIKNLKQENEKSITKLRQEYERNLKELQHKYEKKMKQQREDLELRRKNEIHEIEERKNAHINELMKKHDKAFQEIKVYYNDITLNNIELIKSLKEQLEEVKKKDQTSEKQLQEVTQENKRLSEPLLKSLQEVQQLKQSLANYAKDKLTLQNCKARLKVVEQDLSTLRWEYQVLELRFSQVQKERDDLHSQFTASILDLQRQGGLKSILLEKQLITLQEQLETKEAQLGSVIASANLDPSAVSLVASKVEDLLELKNQSIRDLNYELAKVTKIHNEAVQVYEAKLKEYGISVPIEDLKPLRTVSAGN